MTVLLPISKDKDKMKFEHRLSYIVGVFCIYCIFNIYFVTVYRSSWRSDEDKISKKVLEFLLNEKLEEAESIWKEGVISRHLMEELYSISEEVSWPQPLTQQDGVGIWDFFYPNFNCPHMVERLGRSGDGGKWVCGISHLVKYKKSCIVYSFGVGNEVSFEKELIERANCTVHLYDPTIHVSEAGENIGDRVKYGSVGSFSKFGLGSEDFGVFRTLKSEMQERGDTFIDILKVDIEGWEFKAFDQIIKDFPDQLPFGQLIVELHLTSLPKNGMYQHLKKWWEALENAGLRAFHNEINPIDLLHGSKKSSFYEISFLNIRGNHTLLHY